VQKRKRCQIDFGVQRAGQTNRRPIGRPETPTTAPADSPASAISSRTQSSIIHASDDSADVRQEQRRPRSQTGILEARNAVGAPGSSLNSSRESQNALVGEVEESCGAGTSSPPQSHLLPAKVALVARKLRRLRYRDRRGPGQPQMETRDPRREDEAASSGRRSKSAPDICIDQFKRCVSSLAKFFFSLDFRLSNLSTVVAHKP
jgi:hypothetical protein